MKTPFLKHPAIALGIALVALSSPLPLLAQDHSGHAMHRMPHAGMDHGPAVEKKAARKNPAQQKQQAGQQKAGIPKAAARPRADRHQHGAQHEQTQPADHGQMHGIDHGKAHGMDHGKASPPAPGAHGTHDAAGTAGDAMHQHAMPAAGGKTAVSPDMTGMQHRPSGMTAGPMQGGSPPANARDPDAYANGLKPHGMHGMDMADNAWFGRLTINELEAARGDGHHGQNLNAEAWYGSDYNKAWLKIESERSDGKLEQFRAEVLWDRVFAPFWSTQLGIRHDTGHGPSRDWVAAGVRGLAPYWIETEATAYAGSGGMLAARAEARYELLLTQRLILEPKIEVNFYNRNDAARGNGSGLSNAELDLRLRYEIRRQFAPYLGVTWERKFGNTADFARQAGEDVRQIRAVAGVRMWF